MLRSQLLILLGGCTLLALFHSSEACSCFFGHPQNQICGSNLVIKVKILFRYENNDGGFLSQIFYLARIQKIYRDRTGNNYQVGDYIVLRTCGNTACCGIDWLQSGDTYVFAAYEGPNGIGISLCAYNREWSSLSSEERKLLVQYSKNCACEVKTCSDCKDDSDNCKEGRGCRLYRTIKDDYCAGTCYNKYGVCKPANRCEDCKWQPSKQLEKCLAQCKHKSCPKKVLPIKATVLEQPDIPQEIREAAKVAAG